MRVLSFERRESSADLPAVCTLRGNNLAAEMQAKARVRSRERTGNPLLAVMTLRAFWRRESTPHATNSLAERSGARARGPAYGQTVSMRPFPSGRNPALVYARTNGFTSNPNERDYAGNE
jgi:hypothetical protein